MKTVRAVYLGRNYEVVYYNRPYQEAILKDFGCPFVAEFDKVHPKFPMKFGFHDSAPINPWIDIKKAA